MIGIGHNSVSGHCQRGLPAGIQWGRRGPPSARLAPSQCLPGSPGPVPAAPQIRSPTGTRGHPRRDLGVPCHQGFEPPSQTPLPLLSGFSSQEGIALLQSLYPDKNAEGAAWAPLEWGLDAQGETPPHRILAPLDAPVTNGKG